MGGTPKQDRMLGDAPLLVQTLRALLASPLTAQAFVAVDGERVTEYEGMLEECMPNAPIDVVSGGASRQASVAALVDAAWSARADVLLVHDAARPFVTPDLVDRIVRATLEVGAASPAVAVADTLRRGERNRFGATVDRADLYLIQTPQGFRPNVLRSAHSAADPDAPATDDAGLAAKAGHAVTRVQGRALNFKITTLDDWALAQALWPLWSSGTLQRAPYQID